MGEDDAAARSVARSAVVPGRARCPVDASVTFDAYPRTVTARGTDWTLGVLTALLVLTGVGSWLWAGPWIVVVHDAGGLAMTVVVVVKLRRVAGRIARGAWDRRTMIGVYALGLVWLTLGTGIVWSSERVAMAGFTLLAWHTAAGAMLAIAVLVHLVLRAKRPRRRDVTDRRQVLVLGATAAAGVTAWWLQDPVTRALGLNGSRRRFTGSYERGSLTGRFPVTSWVADDPDPLDSSHWRLRIGGEVQRRRTLTLPQLAAAGDELTALLDCTGGFHTTQRWGGARLDRVLAAARPTAAASHVRVVSVTGYRWWFALEDASGLLLATHVAGQPLTHGHGAPLRLVAPGRRGYQWVKWVVRIDLLDGPDLGAPASTLLSSV